MHQDRDDEPQQLRLELLVASLCQSIVEKQDGFSVA